MSCVQGARMLLMILQSFSCCTFVFIQILKLCYLSTFSIDILLLSTNAFFFCCIILKILLDHLTNQVTPEWSMWRCVSTFVNVLWWAVTWIFTIVVILVKLNLQQFLTHRSFSLSAEILKMYLAFITLTFCLKPFKFN